MTIQLSSTQLHSTIVQYVLAKPLSTDIQIVSDNLQKQNESKIITAFGHFANNQIKNDVITWIQGGFWKLTIDYITKGNDNFNNNNSTAKFTANFTMIKPDGSYSHNHNIDDFTSDKVVFAGKDTVVTGIANIYSDDNNNEYKNVPLTIHLMGNKVLGLTIDVGKTKGHFSSPNEMFGTLISGIGLDTSADNSLNKTMMHHDTATTNHTDKKESMTMMQH